MRFFRDLSATTFTAGFVAVLVGFTSSIAIVFQAARAFGATPEQISSWMWALFIGMGLASAIPSLLLRMPVMVAWSTPGAAVLATAAVTGGFTMADGVGAFIVSGALVTLAGLTGWFEKTMNRIPMAVAAALLAGVLARFGLKAFEATASAPVLVVLMLLTYLLGKRWLARYAVLMALAVGIGVSAVQGQLQLDALSFQLAMPVFTAPNFSLAAVASLALPLFVVTMASQNLPGVAVIRAMGYPLPISKLIAMTGGLTVLLAPFGGFSLNFSAITAAICMGPEAHPDPDRRYTAAASWGFINVLIGLFGAVVTGLLIAFPAPLVAAIAGLALLSTIANGLMTALQDETHREAALITFLVTLSGVTLAGIGSAFWGVVAGALALLIQRRVRPAST